jgi:hypothetical protein
MLSEGEQSPAGDFASEFEASSYEDADDLIEEAERLTDVEMPDEIRAAVLQRAEERDKAHEAVNASVDARIGSGGGPYWREAVADLAGGACVESMLSEAA